MLDPYPPSHRWGSSYKVTNQPVSYVCGYCGNLTGTSYAYYPLDNAKDTASLLAPYSIRICSYCQRPTYLEKGQPSVPSPRIGEDVEHLPKDVDGLYDEMRDATAAGAFTACVLAARKLLMHVAVSKGAAENKKFVHYVKFLADEHHIPKGGEVWVKYIKDRGNEANHEIEIMGEADAKALILLTTQLLRNVYELPNSVPGSPQVTDTEEASSSNGAKDDE